MKDYVKLIHENEKHEDFVVVNWCMGNKCNFSCSYCPMGLHDGSVDWYDYQTVKDFCDNVINHYSPKTVYFEFTGGEITLWKHFKELCDHLHTENSRIGLITNGSRTMRYWEELKPNIDHVCISFHPEFTDENKFLELVGFLSDEIRVHANVMMSPVEFDRCFEVALKLKDIPNISMALQPLIVDFGAELYEYTTEQHDILNRQWHLTSKFIPRTKTFESYRGAMVTVSDTGERLENWAPNRFISNGLNNWKGWSCHAGVEQMVVDMDGTIYRGWCKVGGGIGHITDKNLNLSTQPIICSKDFCHCNFDIMSRKEKV